MNFSHSFPQADYDMEFSDIGLWKRGPKKIIKTQKNLMPSGKSGLCKRFSTACEKFLKDVFHSPIFPISAKFSTRMSHLVLSTVSTEKEQKNAKKRHRDTAATPPVEIFCRIPQKIHPPADRKPNPTGSKKSSTDKGLRAFPHFPQPLLLLLLLIHIWYCFVCARRTHGVMTPRPHDTDS